jgi:alpha-galactosidase
MANIALSQIENEHISGPQCFNDIDMLVTGMYNKGNVARGGMTDYEYLFHFALWCLMASPLMLGNDIRNMKPITKKTILNKELIKINQDKEVRPLVILNNNYIEQKYIVGYRLLENNEILLFAFNFSNDIIYDALAFYDIGLVQKLKLELTNILDKNDKFIESEMLKINLEPHNFVMYKAKIINE